MLVVATHGHGNLIHVAHLADLSTQILGAEKANFLAPRACLWDVELSTAVVGCAPFASSE